MPTIRIPLHSRKHPGLFAVIDPDSLPLVSPYVWRPKPSTYTYYALGDKGDRSSPGLHRIVLGNPEDNEVDHINGNGLDNRRKNLRIVGRSVNTSNRGIGTNTTSGYRGVYYDATVGKWKAQIIVDGARYHLGFHNLAIQAAHAYDNGVRKYRAGVGRINFPQGGEVSAHRDIVAHRPHDGISVFWSKPNAHYQNKAVPVALREEAANHPFLVWKDGQGTYHASSPTVEHALRTQFVIDAESYVEAVEMVQMAISHMLSYCRAVNISLPKVAFPDMPPFSHPTIEGAVDELRRFRPMSPILWHI